MTAEAAGENVRIVALDAGAWQDATDFYAAIAAGVGASTEVRDTAALAEAVLAADAPFRVEIASLHAASDDTLGAIYEAFGALTKAGAKSRIGKDGLGTIEVKLPA